MSVQSVRLSCVGSLLFLVSAWVSQAHAEIIFSDGWESGCWNVHEKVHGSEEGRCDAGVAWRRCQMQGSHSGSVVKHPPAREGQHSMRFQWHRSQVDGSNLKEKAMLHADRDPPAPAQRWYGFSCYFPSETTKNDSERFLFMQMHASPDKDLDEPWRQPFASLDVQQGKLSFQYTYDLERVSPKNKNIVNNRTSVELGDLPRDRWVDFVMYLKYSQSGDGAVQLWMDKKKVVSDKCINLGYNDRLGAFFSIGVYHGNSKSDHETTAILIDAVRIGDETSSYSEVAPR